MSSVKMLKFGFFKKNLYIRGMISMVEDIKAKAMGFSECMDIRHGAIGDIMEGEDHLDFSDKTLTLSGKFVINTPRGPQPTSYMEVLKKEDVSQVTCSQGPVGWMCNVVKRTVVPGIPTFYTYPMESEEEVNFFTSKFRDWLEKPY